MPKFDFECWKRSGGQAEERSKASCREPIVTFDEKESDANPGVLVE